MSERVAVVVADVWDGLVRCLNRERWFDPHLTRVGETRFMRWYDDRVWRHIRRHPIVSLGLIYGALGLLILLDH